MAESLSLHLFSHPMLQFLYFHSLPYLFWKYICRVRTDQISRSSNNAQTLIPPTTRTIMTAASTAAAAAMATVIQNLTALLELKEEHSGFVKNVTTKQDIELLRDELQWRHNALCEAAATQGDPRVENCSRRLRDLCYDIDASIDWYLRLTDRKTTNQQQPRGRLARLADKVVDLTARAMRRRDLAEEIRRFRSRLKEAGDAWHRMYRNCEPSPWPWAWVGTLRVEDRRPPRSPAAGASSSSYAASLAALNGRRDELAHDVVGDVDDDHNSSAKLLRVVSIYGDGGLGRTESPARSTMPSWPLRLRRVGADAATSHRDGHPVEHTPAG